MLKNLFVMSLLAVSLVLTSCGSKEKNQEMAAEIENAVGDGLTLELNGDSDSMTAGGLSSVYFGYNSTNLGTTSRTLLDANAAYLNNNPTLEVQIEGHADERGGVQYNLALGERRSNTVKDYLIAMGVSSNRITVISYGKERPVAFSHDESSWAKNRRGNFVVTAK